MNSDDLNKLSHEDFLLFEERLTAFFKMSVDESFVQLRKHLEKRFPCWRFSDADELIDKSITRLMRKVAEFEKRGERVADLKAYASKIALMITLEHNRPKPVEIDPEPSPDSKSSSASKIFRYVPDVEIGAIEKEIAKDCMMHCLERISRERRVLLFDYYGGDSNEKKQRRRRLALGSVGGPAGAGPEPSERQVKNLQTRVCKVKSKLRECLEECFEAKASRDRKLAFLKAQQTGV